MYLLCKRFLLHYTSGRDGHRTKSGKGRWVPLSLRLWVPLSLRLKEELGAHYARFRLKTYRDRRSPWVFHLTRGARAGQRAGEYRGPVQTAATKAELPEGWRLHDLRHRRVTIWLGEGKSPVHVKEAMGHSTIQVTMGYTHLAREHLRSLVDEPRPAVDLSQLTR